MIELYYWTTPNGHKITMFLEETGLPYRIVPVNISSGAQFEPAFLAISPNNRYRRSSIARRPMAVKRCRCSNRAQFFCISRRKAASYSRVTCAVRSR